MKKTILYLISISLAIMLTECRQEQKGAILYSNQSDLSTIKNSKSIDKATTFFDSRLAKLADTNSMNPLYMTDVINYKLATNNNTSDYIKAQKNFILSSGFPLVNSSGYKNSMPQNFSIADKKYRNFVISNSSNTFIQIFKQNTASIIIRKYLLNDSKNKTELQYYTEELLQSHSQNYPLIYLAIQQLKGYTTDKRISQYKNMIHTDPLTILWSKAENSKESLLISKEKQYKGDTLKALKIMIASSQVAKVRSKYFIGKIDRI